MFTYIMWFNVILCFEYTKLSLLCVYIEVLCLVVYSVKHHLMCFNRECVKYFC